MIGDVYICKIWTVMEVNTDEKSLGRILQKRSVLISDG